MLTVTSEGALRLPVAYETWAAWRDERRLEEPPPDRPAASEFCAMCWSQGRIIAPAANGEGGIPVACVTCAGSGRVPAG
jgi:hypothetical protein